MKTFYLLLALLFLGSCSNSSNEFILNEDFNFRELGWVEEKTNAHHTEILDGELLILSLDTAAGYSSNGPRDNSVLWSLPSNWKFETSIKVIDGGKDAGFGFIIYSATLNYTFTMRRNGQVLVTEYDYTKQKQTPIIEKSFRDYKLDYNLPVSLSIEVRDSNSFEFFVDGTSFGEGNFRAKSWDTLRIFAESGGTGIKADYYRFKEL